MGIDIGYNEEKAVEYIRNYLGENRQEKYSDDDILCVADLIWDFYESKGMLSLNDIEGEEELLNVEELIDYVKACVREDEELDIPSADIADIVKGELEYEESLENTI